MAKAVMLSLVTAAALAAGGAHVWTEGRWIADLGRVVEAMRLPEPAALPHPPPEPAPPAAPATRPEPPAREMPEEIARPSLDIVRLEPDGTALIAGRARPGQPVTVMLDGRAVAMAEAGADGTFVVFAALPADAGAALWLVATPRDGKPAVSSETVLLAPAAPRVPKVALDGPAASAQDDRAETAEMAADGGGPETAAAARTRDAPEVVMISPQDVRLPERPPLSGPTALTLDSIDYGPDGAVILRGRSSPQAEVKLDIPGHGAAAAIADAAGGWTVTVDGLETGRHVLRLGGAAAGGGALDQLTQPFARADPAVLAGGEGRVRLVTVQPGATLWAIAEARYGAGARYVQVFDANRERIADPDLIYPGQIFALPVDGTERPRDNGIVSP